MKNSNEKRTDTKGRLLMRGEYQEPSGLYVYWYKDENGKMRKVTSWRLTKTDVTPRGKKDKPPLREQIKQVITQNMSHVYDNGINVMELIDRYIAQKTGVRANTRAGYKTVQNILKKESFSKLRISKVKTYDAKMFLIKLQQENHRSYSSIHTIRGVLRPAFQMAYEDDLIGKNPFDFELSTVIVNDSHTRDAITRDQERKFLTFIKEDKHFSKYYDAIFILFKTGMRISEFCGLTVDDIDLEEEEIHISKQLQRSREMTYYFEDPKTSAGSRIIPMDDGVADAFRNILSNRKPKSEPTIEGVSGFLFFDKEGKPMIALHWEKYFKHIVEKYNKIYKVPLPEITPHVCRHTFCSNKAKSGMSPKVLQYLMGHSDISVTLGTYTHLGLLDAKEEMKRMRDEEIRKYHKEKKQKQTADKEATLE